MEEPHTEQYSSMEELLHWKLQELQEDYERQDKFWQELNLSNLMKIRNLETEVNVLEEKLKAQSTKLGKTEASLTQKLCIRVEECETSKQRITELTDQLKSLKKELDKRVPAEELLAQESKLKEEKDRQLQELKNKHQQVVEEWKERLNEEEQRHKTVVAKLEKEFSQSSSSKDKEIKELRKQRLDLQSQNKINRREYESNLEKVEEKNKPLVYKIQDLTDQVEHLERTVMKKDDIIQTILNDIAAMREGKSKLQELLNMEKDNCAFVTAQNKDMTKMNEDLTEKLKKKEHEVTKLTKDLSKLKAEKNLLTDTVEKLRYKVRTSVPDLNKMRARVSELETYQLRFKEHLQACMPLIHDPKKFNAKIIALKRHYVDNDEDVEMEKNKETLYKLQIKILEDKIQCAVKKNENQSREIKDLQRRLHKATDEMDNTRIHLVELLNERLLELHDLKLKLKETNKKLQKATKPVDQRIGSWLNKKVLRSSHVAPQVVEEPPALYPDDWRPPFLRDGSIPTAPPASPRPQEKESSSRLRTVIHVIPFGSDARSSDDIFSE